MTLPRATIVLACRGARELVAEARDRGVVVLVAGDGPTALRLLDDPRPSALICDDPSIVAAAARARPDIVALLAVAADTPDALDASDSRLVAPLDAEAVARVALRAEAGRESTRALDELVGATPAMTKLRATIARVAATDASVLLRGESGTGKELAARALHAGSKRAAGPFVAVNAAALPDALLETELFGHEKGAFTGALVRRIGRVERARGGTLFLDEIGDVSPACQVKLLRLLQERTFERVGGDASIPADVRVVTATHRDLEAMVKRGELRADLFYRLDVVSVWLPPLRARRADVPMLARRFVEVLGQRHGRPGLAIDDAALALLSAERWPGNVRQLQNVIERMVVLGVGPAISESEVRAELAETSAVTADVTGTTLATGGPVIPLSDAIRAAESRAIRRALAHTRGNRALAARLLGISRATLYNKLAELGLG